VKNRWAKVAGVVMRGEEGETLEMAADRLPRTAWTIRGFLEEIALRDLEKQRWEDDGGSPA